MRRGGCHGWRLFCACRIRAACKPRGGQSESQHATRGLPRLEIILCLPNPSGLQAARWTVRVAACDEGAATAGDCSVPAESERLASREVAAKTKLTKNVPFVR